jgi:hypothetical protein
LHERCTLDILPADGRLTMKESPDSRFKPADRRWNLFGMVIGTAVGALPAAIPDPVGPFVNWVAFGTLVGFMVPFGIYSHGHSDALRDLRFAWFLGTSGGLIGGVVGAVAWFLGKPLEPEMGLCATCTAGFFAGFLVVDRYLLHLDTRRRHEESLWEHPESE